MKCANGHDVGGKFCTEDGLPPVAGVTDSGVMVKCFACTTDQPAGNQFCGGCSAPMGVSQADLADVIGGVAGMHKALTALPEKISIEPFTPDFDSGDDVLGEDRAAGDDERGDVMGKAIVDRLNGVLGDTGTILGAIETVATENRALRRDMGLMAKALNFLLRGQLSTIAVPTPAVVETPERPRGPKSNLGNQAQPRSLTILGKSLTDQQEQTDTRDGADLKGEELMRKAQTARRANGERILSSLEVGLVAKWANRNGSLADICAERPDLGARVKEAIEAAA